MAKRGKRKAPDSDDDIKDEIIVATSTADPSLSLNGGRARRHPITRTTTNGTSDSDEFVPRTEERNIPSPNQAVVRQLRERLPKIPTVPVVPTDTAASEKPVSAVRDTVQSFLAD